MKSKTLLFFTNWSNRSRVRSSNVGPGPPGPAACCNRDGEEDGLVAVIALVLKETWRGTKASTTEVCTASTSSSSASVVKRLACIVVGPSCGVVDENVEGHPGYPNNGYVYDCFWQKYVVAHVVVHHFGCISAAS